MLKENFVFSFRNTIEVRAFTSLDRKYFEESVNLMVIGMAKLESEIQVALERCTTRDEREEEWKSSENSIRQEAHRLGEEMKKKMEKFFETSEDRATLDQWKENVMNRIVELKENQESEVNKTCKATFNFLQNQQDVEKKEARL
jgi:predicted transcriptional regulator